MHHCYRSVELPVRVFDRVSCPCDRAGSSRYKVWEAVQASAAAPGYFQECRIGDMLHQVRHGRFIVHILDLGDGNFVR